MSSYNQFREQVREACRIWRDENPPEDGCDSVTPFDRFLYVDLERNGDNARAQEIEEKCKRLGEHIDALKAGNRDLHDQVRRLSGLACLVCGRKSEVEFPQSGGAYAPCTFDPNPIEAAQRLQRERNEALRELERLGALAGAAQEGRNP